MGVMSLEEAYDLLGLQTGATNDEVKSAYKKLARQTHPDKNKSDPDAKEKFQRISEALNRIINPDEYEDSEVDDDEWHMNEEDAFDLYNFMFVSIGGHIFGVKVGGNTTPASGWRGSSYFNRQRAKQTPEEKAQARVDAEMRKATAQKDWQAAVRDEQAMKSKEQDKRRRAQEQREESKRKQKEEKRRLHEERMKMQNAERKKKQEQQEQERLDELKNLTKPAARQLSKNESVQARKSRAASWASNGSTSSSPDDCGGTTLSERRGGTTKNNSDKPIVETELQIDLVDRELRQFVEMGFSAQQVRRAARQAHGDPDLLLERLLSEADKHGSDGGGDDGKGMAEEVAGWQKGSRKMGSARSSKKKLASEKEPPSHKAPSAGKREREPLRPCRFFNNGLGECYTGDDCPFLHADTRGAFIPWMACKYYDQGHCNHGDGCNYLHGDQPPDVRDLPRAPPPPLPLPPPPPPGGPWGTARAPPAAPPAAAAPPLPPPTAASQEDFPDLPRSAPSSPLTLPAAAGLVKAAEPGKGTKKEIPSANSDKVDAEAPAPLALQSPAEASNLPTSAFVAPLPLVPPAESLPVTSQAPATGGAQPSSQQELEHTMPCNAPAVVAATPSVAAPPKTEPKVPVPPSTTATRPLPVVAKNQGELPAAPLFDHQKENSVPVNTAGKLEQVSALSTDGKVPSSLDKQTIMDKLIGMGFESEQVSRALDSSGGEVEVVVDNLLNGKTQMTEAGEMIEGTHPEQKDDAACEPVTETQREEVSYTHSSTRIQVCRFYDGRERSCRYGFRCKFLHSPAITETAESAKLAKAKPSMGTTASNIQEGNKQTTLTQQPSAVAPEQYVRGMQSVEALENGKTDGTPSVVSPVLPTVGASVSPPFASAAPALAAPVTAVAPAAPEAPEATPVPVAPPAPPALARPLSSPAPAASVAPAALAAPVAPAALAASVTPAAPVAPVAPVLAPVAPAAQVAPSPSALPVPSAPSAFAQSARPTLKPMAPAFQPKTPLVHSTPAHAPSNSVFSALARAHLAAYAPMFQPHLHSAAFPHTQMSSLAAVTAALLQQSSTPALTPAPAQTSLPPTAVRSALTPASHQITPQSGPQPALPISTVQHQNTATAVLSQAKVSQKQGQACTPSSSKDLTADEPADQPVKSTQTLEPEVLKQLLEKSSNYRQLVNLWLQKLGGVTAVPLAKYLQVEGQTVLVNLAPFGGTARLPAPRSLGRSKGADEEVARRVWLEVLEMPYLEDQLDADKTVGQATSVSKKAGENTPADSIEVQAQLSSLHKSEGLPAEGGTPSSTNAEKEEILDPGNSFASRKLKPEVLQRIIRNSSNYRMLINSFMLRTNGPKPYTQCVTFEDESPDAEPMVSVDLGLLGKGRFTAPKDWGSKAADEELAKRVWTEVMQLPPMPQPDLKAPTAEDVQERPTTGGAQTEECGASKIACQAVEGALKQPGKGLKQQSQEQKANPSAPTPQVSIVSPMTWAQEDEHIALWSEEDIHYVCQNWARQFPTQIPDKDMQIDCRLLELIKNIQGSCMYVHDTMSKKGVPGPLTGDNIRRRYLAPLALRILQYVDGCNEEDSDVAAEERAFQQASGIPTTQHNPLPPSHIYTRPCRFFGKGFCRHGDKCRYSHNDVAVSSSYSYRRSPPRTHHSHPQHQHYTQRRGPSVQHDDR